MKLCVACLARTDMTPRPPSAVDPVEAASRPAPRAELDSLFDAEEEIPTSLYRPRTRAPSPPKSRVQRAALRA